MAKTTVATYDPAASFDDAPVDMAYRTILRVVGERGTGKTRLTFTGREPIFHFSFDQGDEGVVEEFAQQKTIKVRNYDWDPGKSALEADEDKQEFSKAYAVEVRNHFEADLAYAVKQCHNNGGGTIDIDKETDLWLLYRYAEFGGPSDAPKNYDELNRRYISMVNSVKAARGTNLILIQGMKDEWGNVISVVNGQKKKQPYPTGRRIPSGFDRIDEIVFAEIMTHRVIGENAKQEKEVRFYFDFKADFDTEFGKCRQNTQLSGERFPAMTLPELGTMLIDGSEESDWL